MLLLVLFGVYSYSIPRVYFGLGMGGMAPDNEASIQSTWGKDFYWSGVLGISDESGWGIRANYGNYTNASHYPADVDKNLRVGISPLLASVVYNWGTPSTLFQPYIGGGVGGYFYDVRQDILGIDSSLKSGTVFGPHLLAGIKINLLKSFCLVAEYNKYYIPSIGVFNASNFESSAFIIGMEFSIPIIERQQSAPVQATTTPYKFSSEEEELLIQIQQIQTELTQMKTKRKQMQEEIDIFYSSNEYDESNKDFTAKYNQAKFKESQIVIIDRKITEAQKNLDSLNQKWQTAHADNQPVETQVVYLQQNYVYSPYGVHYKNGFLYRRNSQPTMRYNRGFDSNQAVNNNSPLRAVDRTDYEQKKNNAIKELGNRGSSGVENSQQQTKPVDANDYEQKKKEAILDLQKSR